jgi:hypothetical protein
MTTSTDRSTFRFFTALTGFTAYRFAVGFLLDPFARREILLDATTQKVLQTTPLIEMRKGFQPTAIKYFTASYLQAASLWTATRMTPTDLPPAVRGVMFGVMTNVIEASVKNSQNVLVTRFIQGDKWNIIHKEGPSIFTKGISPAVLHRIFSGCVFWGLYEPFKQKFPDQTLLIGLSLGQVQVVVTSPFYNLATLMQAKQTSPTTMWGHVKELKQTQSLARMLFVRGLFPRAVHSLLVSGPWTHLLENFNLIHR